MSETECLVRRWGNSLGVIIPKEIVIEERLQEDERVLVSFEKPHKVKEFFGLWSDWRRPTAEIKQEMKRGWG